MEKYRWHERFIDSSLFWGWCSHGLECSRTAFTRTWIRCFQGA